MSEFDQKDPVSVYMGRIQAYMDKLRTIQPDTYEDLDNMAMWTTAIRSDAQSMWDVIHSWRLAYAREQDSEVG
jgi:hypothetical protein